MGSQNVNVTLFTQLGRFELGVLDCWKTVRCINGVIVPHGFRATCFCLPWRNMWFAINGRSSKTGPEPALQSYHPHSHCSWAKNLEHPLTKKTWNNTPTTNPSSMAIIRATPKFETSQNMTVSSGLLMAPFEEWLASGHNQGEWLRQESKRDLPVGKCLLLKTHTRPKKHKTKGSASSPRPAVLRTGPALARRCRLQTVSLAAWLMASVASGIATLLIDACRSAWGPAKVCRTSACRRSRSACGRRSLPVNLCHYVLRDQLLALA